MRKKRSKWKLVFIVIIILWLVSMFLSRVITVNVPGGDKIAVIPITGTITVQGDSLSLFGESAIKSSALINRVEEADENDRIKGIILEINSPGGTVVASEEVAHAIRDVEKPVVALIREIGTSGAYWVASASDKIVADPLSLTGSIGVTSSYLEFSELFKRYGINYESLIAGEYKDAGSPYKKLSIEERKMLQDKLDMIHEIFIDEIAENRNLKRKDVERIANGMFYLGKEAYEHGLVDYLGDKETAINITKELAKIKEAELVSYQPKKESLLDIIRRMFSEAFFFFGRGLGSELKISKEFTIMS